MEVLPEQNGHAAVVSRRFQRSDAAQEIISNKPELIIRRGGTIFLFVFLLMCGLCWFIKYPDIIQASAKLTSINAPKAVVSVTGGKLVKILVKEGDLVGKGQVLGYLESTSSHEEIIRLAGCIDSVLRLMTQKGKTLTPVAFDRQFSGLGELQGSFQIMQQAWLIYRNYLPKGFWPRKKEMLLHDIENLQELNANLEEQKKIQVEDLKLSEKTFDANQYLKTEKIISDVDYRSEQSKLLIKKISLPQINYSILINTGQQNDKRKEIAELDNAAGQQEAIFQQAVRTFKSQLEDWMRKYLLMAPLDGRIRFAGFWQENEHLQPNQAICYVNPERSQYFVQIVIPQTNFGKVAIGQRVLLKLSSYQFEEYGPVRGRISMIFNIPTDSGFSAQVDLIDSLNASQSKEIRYRDGLVARAEIITKDMRLIERLYYNIVKQVKKE